MALTDTTSFKVVFGSIEKNLTSDQLKRAPNSLVSAALLSDTNAGDQTKTLIVQSRPVLDHVKATASILWENGTEELFEVRAYLKMALFDTLILSP